MQLLINRLSRNTYNPAAPGPGTLMPGARPRSSDARNALARRQWARSMRSCSFIIFYSMNERGPIRLRVVSASHVSYSAQSSS